MYNIQNTLWTSIFPCICDIVYYTNESNGRDALRRERYMNFSIRRLSLNILAAGRLSA